MADKVITGVAADVAYEGFRSVSENGLPIFRQDGSRYTVYYAPGYLCLVHPSHADRFALELLGENSEAVGNMSREATAVRKRALEALTARQSYPTFQPECLTLYLHNKCNLGCTFCFAAAVPNRPEHLRLAEIRAAAELVTTSCRQNGRKFTVVFHGGGEPTFDIRIAKRVLALINQISQEIGVPVFRYIATNGVVSEDTATWLARNFDLIGLSCDGPSDLQDLQRPLAGGGGTSQYVERTARLLCQEGAHFNVRATITRDNVHRQAELASYFCQVLKPDALSFEPVYEGGRGSGSTWDGFSAAEFVGHFLSARRSARYYRTPIQYAGTRLGEVHGPYCNVFRNVVNLVPGGIATACLKCTDSTEVNRQGMAIGTFDPGVSRFLLDHDQIVALQAKLWRIPSSCGGCFNQFHCVGSCPDTCLMAEEPISNFRCQVQQKLASAYLQEIADKVFLERSSGVVSNRANGRETNLPSDVWQVDFEKGFVYGSPILP